MSKRNVQGISLLDQMEQQAAATATSKAKEEDDEDDEDDDSVERDAFFTSRGSDLYEDEDDEYEGTTTPSKDILLVGDEEVEEGEERDNPTPLGYSWAPSSTLGGSSGLLDDESMAVMIMDESGTGSSRQFMMSASYGASDFSPQSSFSESATDMMGGSANSGMLEDDSMRTSNTDNGGDGNNAFPRLQQPRRSFSANRRSSFESSSGETRTEESQTQQQQQQPRRSSRVSFASAPARTGEATPSPVATAPRRLTISVPNDARMPVDGDDHHHHQHHRNNNDSSGDMSNDVDWRRSTRRRRSIRIGGNSITAASDLSSSTRGSGSSSSSRRNQLASSLPTMLQSIRNTTVSFRGRFDRRGPNNHSSPHNGGGGGGGGNGTSPDHAASAPTAGNAANNTIDGKRVAFSSLDNAVSALADQTGSQWHNVAAAAAVVAASATYKRSNNNLYDVDTKVLVLMTLLNVTNKVDSKDLLTVCPVNRFGYPAGEGKTEEERSGPFNYVLCTVKKAHFDEDDRYYTVIRADTGSEQRADSGWMEPINEPAALEAAERAARRTGRSAARDAEEEHPSGVWSSCTDCGKAIVSWPARFAKTKVVPAYTMVRTKTKEQVAHVLYGDSPFACKVRLTIINLLVICSFVYLFIEVAALAFFPADWDFVVAVIGLTVWLVLVLELLLELLIRPSGYNQMVSSDKAYAPSTARHLNGFHLVCESIALLTFLPEFDCLKGRVCGRRVIFSLIDAALAATLSISTAKAVFGRFRIGLASFRLFGLVRHWKQMWIKNTFNDNMKRGMIQSLFLENDTDVNLRRSLLGKRKKVADQDDSNHDDLHDSPSKPSSEEDQRLKRAATIGTALMVVNSQRALLLLAAIITILPMIKSVGGQNRVAPRLVNLLQQNNIIASTNASLDCAFLENAITTWLYVAASEQPRLPRQHASLSLLWANLQPVRCPFQNPDGVITICTGQLNMSLTRCDVWNMHKPNMVVDATPEYFASELNIRVGGITRYASNQTVDGQPFSVTVLFDENDSVATTAKDLFILLATYLVLVLCGLTIMRDDAGRLVLDPLQRMLKIVVRYAENPLSQNAQDDNRKRRRNGDEADEDEMSDPDQQAEREQLGHYETEQLINAISKIADLLRKCWGVAGAGIISSNLARTKDGKTVVFNPTVPGKRVYALFGFVAINGFSQQLRALDKDVMILINDVAKVVHDEVYRWALGDSGQCNKNLGAAFLMVFRIGDFTEVHDKNKIAAAVVFDSHQAKRIAKKIALLRRRGRGSFPRKRRVPGRGKDHDDTLQLASLPGIQAFTDRALLGMLKSFASIHRDRNLQNWKRDFRLGAGVGAFSVDVIYGMDAGWAVEGAVGSEYKIDATYLSPHVNMASRMMSATKQYGVTILLSQAVEELLSRPARAKLRHLDTVTVKGSSVPQRIFTYDARHKGVDFFLLERSPEQADAEADAYSSAIWETDQDLKQMRQHISDEFMEKFKEGVEQYIDGNWKASIETLTKADDMMIAAVLEEGYIEYNPDDIDGRIFDRRNSDEEITRLRNELGDGPCRCLVTFMEKRGGIPPDDWNGVRQLLSK